MVIEGMITKNIMNSWNTLDSIIFTVENKIEELVAEIKENKGSVPEPEEMIEAETRHLQEENETLKELQFPKPVRKDKSSYICPNVKCQIKISSVLVEQYRIKFCPECGQRIFLNQYKTAEAYQNLQPPIS